MSYPMFSSRSMNPPQKSPAKPPLITPSASPPPRLSLFSYPENISLPDAAPPPKRQRLGSTPHRASHDTSSSTSRPQSPANVQREREASKLRLLGVWSSLAERYTRRLDEDDIVDIRTGVITQDRGFIRNSRKVEFGAIAAPVIGDAPVDEGTDEDDEDEYDVDELDAFADTTSETDNAGQSEMGLRVRPVPPVTALDSADAEDLRKFLEAEQRRKQLCGSEIGEEEDDHSTSDIQIQCAEVEYESATDLDNLDPLLLNDAPDTSKVSHSSQTALYADSASEDELDNWDIDDSSVVYPVLKHEDSDSDIEIIDGPTLRPPPSPPPIQTVLSGGTPTQSVVSVPSSPKPSSIKTGLGNTPGPHLDLTQVLKVKKPAMNDSALRRSPNKRTSTGNAPTPDIKPYVLLTPSKSIRPAKSKAEKQNNGVDEGQELDPFKDSSPRKAVEKGKAKTKVNEPFETMITAKASTSEDGKVFDTDRVKERRRRNSSESKSYGEDSLAVVPFQVESPHQTDKRPSLPPKPRSLGNRKDNQRENLREGSRSPRPSGSFFGEITSNAPERQSSMPRKRKRVSSDSGTAFAVQKSIMPREDKLERHFTPRRTSFSNDLPYHESRASAFHMISEKKVVQTKSIRRSSRSHRPRATPKPSVSGSGSESGDSSDSERGYSLKSAPSHFNNFQFPHHYPYPHHYQPYTPHRKQQHHPPPPEMLPPPIPDPRAQFIITQAMQQLSALVGTPWTPPHDSPSIPYTPTRRHQSTRPSAIINTPSHRPHPYPYSYDPNLSLATLPPESPEPASSPERPSHRPRKSSMARSRSRGRRVSFKLDDDESSDGDGGHGRVDVCSSPSNILSSRRGTVIERGRQNTTKISEEKGKAKAETPTSESGSEDPLICGNGRDGKSYPRGQTPGPSIVPPKGRKRGQTPKGG